MSDLKYKYAYDQDNNIIFINDAFKNNYGQKYYLINNSECELTLADGVKNQKHFRIKKGASINGVIVSGGSFGESQEHHNAKMEIIKNGYFNWSDYKIHIKNTKYEYKLEGSRYRADLFAELLCGTPCAIEIIISSNVSESKKEFIKENEILTFEIYYDKNGLQQLKQFDCYGNEKIGIVKAGILEFKSRTDELRRTMPKEKSRIRDRYNSEFQGFESRERKEFDIFMFEFRERESRIKREIFDITKQIQSITSASGIDYKEVNELESKVKCNINAIRETKREIEKCSEIYRRFKSEADKINELEVSIGRLEDSFRKAAENCKIEWFGNYPIGMNKYQFIKYMCE